MDLRMESVEKYVIERTSLKSVDARQFTFHTFRITTQGRNSKGFEEKQIYIFPLFSISFSSPGDEHLTIRYSD